MAEEKEKKIDETLVVRDIADIKEVWATYVSPIPLSSSKRFRLYRPIQTDEVLGTHAGEDIVVEESLGYLDEIAEQIDKVCAQIDAHQAVTRQLAADTRRGLSDLAKVVATL